MDFSIRFGDSEKQEVVSRYLGAQFLGHATAPDLLHNFKEGTSKLKARKITQISMDGPKVNLKFHRDLVADRLITDPEIPTLLDIGTCGLHVIHGAFRTGFNSTGWMIDNLLRSLFYLFNESPARRADYSTLTDSQVFPLQFCGTRWVEDLKVAERAIEIWENITKYIETVSSGPKNKIPKSASYKSVSKAVNDPTTVAKLFVFINVAKTFQPFLKKFQSDKPMVPFMDEEICVLMKTLMENFVKRDLVSGKNSMSALLEVDHEETKNHVAMKKVVVGFAATTSLAKAGVSVVSTEFKYKCLLCYKSILSKLKYRSSSPCNSKLVPQLRCLNPKYMIHHPNGTVDKFESVLSTLIEHHFVKPADCDDLLKQYKALINLIKLEHKEDFISYDIVKSMRIDTLFNSIIGNKTEFLQLWEFFKIILALSHGQASVERGFSINKQTMETNMLERTIVGQRVVCDGVSNCLEQKDEGNVSKVKISEEMVKYCRAARMRYNNYLSDRKVMSKKNHAEIEKLSLKEEIGKEKCLKIKFNNAIRRLNTEADELAQKAEKEKKMSLLVDSNAARKRSSDLKHDLEGSVSKLQKLEDRLNNISLLL